MIKWINDMYKPVALLVLDGWGISNNSKGNVLKETDLQISEIAYKVGFSSPSNFNRVFKNLTDKNPSEFLQSNE